MNEAKYIKALAKQIDKLREQRGLSFQAMADACGMDKAQVYKLCKSGTNITATTIAKISRGLEVPIAEIFNFKY